MAFLWFSANLTANNLAVAFLGPLIFGLGFTDAALCALFGGTLGSAMTAYMSIWGAESGNRTMVGFFTPCLFLSDGGYADFVTGCSQILHGILAIQDLLSP